MKKLLILGLLVSLVAGCMSVMRIPITQYREWQKDPETKEYVLVKEETVGSCPGYPMSIYPSLHVRYDMVAFAWRPAPEGYHWRHYCGPVAGIVSCIGLPGDLLIDTLYLPRDWGTINVCKLCTEVIEK